MSEKMRFVMIEFKMSHSNDIADRMKLAVSWEGTISEAEAKRALKRVKSIVQDLTEDVERRRA